MTQLFDEAMAAWRRGEAVNAITTLATAAHAGDEPALGVMLDLAISCPPSSEERQKASSALRSMQGREARRLQAAAAAAGWLAPPSAEAALEARLSDAQRADKAALTELGLLALMAGDDTLARSLLVAAVDAGSGHALAALLRMDVEAGALHRPLQAMAEPLLRSGHPLAQSLAYAARDLPVSPDPQTPSLSLTGISARDFMPAFAAAGAASPLCGAPSIRRVSKAFPAAVCDYLASGAAGLLRPSTVHAGEGADVARDTHRTGLSAAIGPSASDLALTAFKARMAALADMDSMQGEWLSVIAYRPGEEYRPHFDFLTPGGAAADADLAQRGQRVRTTLVLLNAEFSAGETIFPRLDVTWRGERGDALVFDNVDSRGEGDPRTLHAGAPVRDGMKLIASLWLRERAW